MSQPSTDLSETPQGLRRVQARVGLILLETLRSQDLPGEVLDDEDVSLTIPRRLGLSGVVEAQIRRYRRESGRRGRVTETEIRDLVRLVIRRPDAEQVFVLVGRSLAPGGGPGWRRFLPRKAALPLAGRRIQRRLKVLFGGPLVRQGEGSLAFESVDDLLIEADPGGEACGLVTGLCQAVLEAYGLADRVLHVECRGRGDPRCGWSLEEERTGAPEEHGR